MKKLKLKLDGMKEMLTKEQMKKISGGYDYYDASWYCWNCDCAGSTITMYIGKTQSEALYACQGYCMYLDSCNTPLAASVWQNTSCD